MSGAAVTSANRPARLNRALLGSFGLLLAGSGGLSVAAHFGRLDWVDARAAVLPDRPSPPAWVLWTIVVCAGAAGLACLRWVIAQLPRTPRSVRWRARTPDSGDSTTLDTAIACAPVAADIRTYEGVRSATARLSGPGGGPGLHLVVTAAPDVDVTALRDRIRTHAVPRLRQALELDTLPVRMEVHLARNRTRWRKGSAGRPPA